MASRKLSVSSGVASSGAAAMRASMSAASVEPIVVALHGKQPARKRAWHLPLSASLEGSGSKRSIVAVAVAEQPELRGIARWLSEAEMSEGVRGQKPAARGALQIAALDQERLDDVLDGVARLRQRRRHGLDADRPAAVVQRDGREIAPVHGVEAGGIDLQRA